MNVSKAIERAEKIKADKRSRCKQKNQDKEEIFNTKKLLILQNELK